MKKFAARLPISFFLSLLALALPPAAGSSGAHPYVDPRAEMGSDCAAASLRVQPIAKIVNTRNPNYQCLGVSVDAQENITALRFENHDFVYDAASEREVARAVDIREFTPTEIASRRGVVLDGTPGHDALILHGDIGPGHASAVLSVKFLYNGVTQEFRQCAVTLGRASDANWRLVDQAQRPVSLIVVKTWSLPLIGTVGIDTVQGVCANG